MAPVANAAASLPLDPTLCHHTLDHVAVAGSGTVFYGLASSDVDPSPPLACTTTQTASVGLNAARRVPWLIKRRSHWPSCTVPGHRHPMARGTHVDTHRVREHKVIISPAHRHRLLQANQRTAAPWESSNSDRSHEPDAHCCAHHCRRRFPDQALRRARATAAVTAVGSHRCFFGHLGAAVHLIAQARFSANAGDRQGHEMLPCLPPMPIRSERRARGPPG